MLYMYVFNRDILYNDSSARRVLREKKEKDLFRNSFKILMSSDWRST